MLVFICDAFLLGSKIGCLCSVYVSLVVSFIRVYCVNVTLNLVGRFRINSVIVVVCVCVKMLFLCLNWYVLVNMIG